MSVAKDASSSQGSSSASFLELFFDLVFVYAFTQVTALMATDVSVEVVAQGLVVLALL